MDESRCEIVPTKAGEIQGSFLDANSFVYFQFTASTILVVFDGTFRFLQSQRLQGLNVVDVPFL